PGWQVTTTDTDGRHTADYTTPTGATYHSTAPPLPGPSIRRRYSVIEGGLSIDIVELGARLKRSA
ncbi:HNH endonuclease, partial [Mycolicibacterium sp. 3033]|nr:HNH endonuclease [Mycolicibacterium aurantiacum]